MTYRRSSKFVKKERRKEGRQKERRKERETGRKGPPDDDIFILDAFHNHNNGCCTY